MPYYLARLQGHYNVQIQLQRGGVGYVPFTSQAAAVQNVQQYNHGVVYDPWNRVVFQAGQGVAAVPSSYQAPQTQGVPPSATGYWQVFTADGRRSIKYTDPNLALQNHRNNPGGRLVANVAAPPPRWAYLTNTVLT